MSKHQHQAVEQAMVVTSGRVDPNQAVTRLALYDESGAPIDFDGGGGGPVDPPTGADVLLTGYEAGDAEPVDAADTANEAIAKLEARVLALETAA